MDRKNEKYNTKIEYYKYIDLRNFIDDKNYKFATKYKLIGVSSYLGISDQYGKYISFCLCDDNMYYSLNDSIILKIDENKVYQFYEGSPYILFYQRESS